MPNISNPQDTETVWLEALERDLQTYQANVRRACPTIRALSDPEIRGILDYAERTLQYFAQYSAVAAELMQLGFPRLKQRLDYVQRDLGDAIQIYADMLRSALAHQAYRAQIQRETSAYVTRTIQDATLHSQKVFDQSLQMRSYVNHGMSFGWAEFLAKMPK